MRGLIVAIYWSATGWVGTGQSPLGTYTFNGCRVKDKIGKGLRLGLWMFGGGIMYIGNGWISIGKFKEVSMGKRTGHWMGGTGSHIESFT
ncbi:hypothetical protein B0T20DRAFT_427715 [Sordaria brevicollis]|uniref:Uncharacterized protein n=1 Tax=Sordaria brevicollis TaxID=83679 RepID=A0AAE0U0L6_SORBR|nr:hypothetical protein B0T20DRAFT_427715 [Sordaria brevicollis]